MNFRNKVKKLINTFSSKDRKIVCLTAYTAPMACLINEYCDIILVGDSLGIVLYDLKTTRKVTLEMMINHSKAVVKNANKKLVIVDMPFGTYENSKSLALKNARKIIKESKADAVKLEGGEKIYETVKYLTHNGINVMGHIGMLPQSIKGSPKVYGKTKLEKKQILKDLKLLENAGVFSIVVECTLETVVREVLKEKRVPIIGIGASPECDGQILVTEDILGMSNFKSKFLKKYFDFNQKSRKPLEKFYKDVSLNKFPSKKQCY